MPRITLPEPHRGFYAVGPLLFEDGVFEQDEPLTPVQLRLAEALYADVEGGEEPEPEASDEGASGRHAADAEPGSTGADAPVGSPVTPPEEVAAAASTEGSISTQTSEPDGSEVVDAPASAPVAEPEGEH